MSCAAGAVLDLAPVAPPILPAALLRMGRRHDDPFWAPAMTEREITGYLRAVEGRLAGLESWVKNAEVTRAEIKAAIAELRAELARHVARAEERHQQLAVSDASRSWIERVAWILLTAAITSGFWWFSS